MHRASVSINHTQRACVYVHAIKCMSPDRHLSHLCIARLLLQMCGEETHSGLWQMTTTLFRWEMSRLWPSECPRLADTQCGVRDVIGWVAPETITGKRQYIFSNCVTSLENEKLAESEGLILKILKIDAAFSWRSSVQIVVKWPCTNSSCRSFSNSKRKELSGIVLGHERNIGQPAQLRLTQTPAVSGSTVLKEWSAYSLSGKPRKREEAKEKN